MKYQSYNTQECPKCGNDELDGREHKFCKICGLPTKNHCTGGGCNEKADHNARYCARCGRQTVYFQRCHFTGSGHGFLPVWQDEKKMEGLKK